MGESPNAESDHDNADGRDPSEVSLRNVSVWLPAEVFPPHGQEHPTRNQQPERIPEWATSIWSGRRNRPNSANTPSIFMATVYRRSCCTHILSRKRSCARNRQHALGEANRRTRKIRAAETSSRPPGSVLGSRPGSLLPSAQVRRPCSPVIMPHALGVQFHSVSTVIFAGVAEPDPSDAT